MDILSYILDEGLIMIPALWFLGYIIKNTKKIDKCYIPFILLVISLTLTPLLLGGYVVENIVQAILVVAGAVLSHELVDKGEKIVKGE